MMDEPEQALDMDGILDLCAALRETKAAQVMIATHSQHLVLAPDFHHVELRPGHRHAMRAALRELLAG